MKININNTEKLEAAIREAQGKATARTVTAEDIVWDLQKIDVPKARLNGTKVFYDGESTHWTAENVNGRWYITDIRRDTCPNRNTSGHIEFGDAAKDWINKHMSEM